MITRASDAIIRHIAAENRPSSNSGKSGDGDVLLPHLLLPLSSHSKADAGLSFISRFFSDNSSVRLSLMHIPPSQAAVWAEETSYESLDVLEVQAVSADKKGRKVIADARRTLQNAGFDPDKIDEKVQPPQMGKARDIIREARKGRYDAVVLGRRVQAGLIDIMDQSVCREMLEALADSISFPLWLCRLPEAGRKNVLLCVDGSDPSDRMTDHVGYMLSHELGHEVTVFHVHDPGKHAHMEAEATVNHAVDILIEAGMPLDRIKKDVRRGGNPARLIETEYDAGNYAAVAIGSAGTDRGFWNKMFVGSVARNLFKELHGAALWVCF